LKVVGLDELSTLSNDDASSLSYEIHPQASRTSKSLGYKDLPEPKNSKEINEHF
jgi:hypothetical protein